MTQPRAKIRLHVAADLGEGREVVPDRDQAHYLFAVMRQAVGANILLFNGRDGEWLAEITEAGKRGGRLACLSHTRQQTMPPDLWLCFAPIKKARTDFIAEKACEMGCRRILPMRTRFTNTERVRTERLQAHAIEAAEQCGLVSVPEIADPVSFGTLLDTWDPARQILFCDESGQGGAAKDLLVRVGESPRLQAAPWAILIGPEGGFDPDEAARLRGLPFAHAASLGPRILRADTAAVAALAIWQAILGDWK